ncbi:hypothetical protein Tco_0479237, partial [Tanacetum coccineum]
KCHTPKIGLQLKGNIGARCHGTRKKKSRKRRKPSPNTKSRSSYPSQSPAIFTRLRHGDSEPYYHGNSAGTDVFTRLGERERNVFTRLGNNKQDIFSRLESKDLSHHEKGQYPQACQRTESLHGPRPVKKRGQESHLKLCYLL